MGLENCKAAPSCPAHGSRRVRNPHTLAFCSFTIRRYVQLHSARISVDKRASRRYCAGVAPCFCVGQALNCHARSSKRYTLTEVAIPLHLLCAGGCIGPVCRPRSARPMSSWGSYQLTTVTSDGSSNSSAPASTGYFGGAGGPSLPHLVTFTLATIGVAFTLGEQRQGH